MSDGLLHVEKWFILRESLEKAPVNGWLDGLRHFNKSIHFQMNCIQSYREIKFDGHSQTCITLWKKILRPRKKWNMNKFYFPKIERPGFEGVDALRHFTKMMLFLEMLSITVRKRCFSKYHICPKNVKKCPRDAKTALGISGVGEG